MAMRPHGFSDPFWDRYDQREKECLKNLIEQDLMRRHFNAQGRVFQKTPIKPPPELVCIQFIGGPANGEQIFLNWKANPQVQQGSYYDIPLDSLPTFNFKEFVPNSTVDQVRYKLTFIPMQETPFSDAQIVVGIFQ